MKKLEMGCAILGGLFGLEQGFRERWHQVFPDYYLANHPKRVVEIHKFLGIMMAHYYHPDDPRILKYPVISQVLLYSSIGFFCGRRMSVEKIQKKIMEYVPSRIKKS